MLLLLLQQFFILWSSQQVKDGHGRPRSSVQEQDWFQYAIAVAVVVVVVVLVLNGPRAVNAVHGQGMTVVQTGNHVMIQSIQQMRPVPTQRCVVELQY